MGTVRRYPNGTFAWVDLTTPDPATAQGFYRRLFGWEVVATGDEARGYGVCRVAGHDVAAIGDRLRERSGGPARWNSYISVDDVDAASRNAGELGAKLLAGPVDVADRGRMAVLVDPGGAVVALWQPGRHIGATLVNEPASLTWNDLNTHEPETSVDFYAGLFGWHADPSPDGVYFTFTLADLLVAGAYRLPPEAASAPAEWVPYFVTENVEASVQAADDEDGSLVVPVREVPAGRIAVLRDPWGATFGLFEFGAEGPSRGVDSL